MKKFAVAVAVVALVAFAAPVFAATNPFMDVPMNHWSYDAIGQLAAHGILSGYPDGTYKGKQPTTRYEMASALARALAVVDMTKASKQDVEMLKKLVVEFKDELEALGVRVDDLDERVKVLEDRLGGWHIHGQMRFDIEHTDNEDGPNPDSRAYLNRARLWFERTFGENDDMFFRARLDNTNNGATWQQFFVTMPFFWDSRLTVGRFLAYEEMLPYYLGGDTNYDSTQGGAFTHFDDILGDRQITGLGFEKTFGMGSVRAYVAHPNQDQSNRNGQNVFGNYEGSSYNGRQTSFGNQSDLMGGRYGAWEAALMGSFQFTEQFGFDVGGHVLFHDNAEPAVLQRNADGPRNNISLLSNMWNIWAGLRFNFNEDIAFRGLFFHQKWKYEDGTWNGNRYGWVDGNDDDANHWRVVLDVNQNLLKFTSVWLEYGQYGDGFHFLTSPGGGESAVFGAAYSNAPGANNSVPELKYWRVALHQQWNEKWSTHLFYYGYRFDDDIGDLTEWGLGVKYQYNPSVAFGLNYIKVDGKDGRDDQDDHVVRFRTFVTF